MADVPALTWITAGVISGCLFWASVTDSNTFTGLMTGFGAWPAANLIGRRLLIFFSTLGGLLLFGATGFILGPILAALFVTAWEMFGTAFRSALVEPGSPPPRPVDAAAP